MRKVPLLFVSVFVYTACSELFFECVGDNVPAHQNAKFWQMNEAKRQKEEEALAKTALVSFDPSADVAFKEFQRDTFSHDSARDNSKDVVQSAAEYARTFLCPAKFGAGDYEVCFLPTIAYNKVYAKIDGYYRRVVEPIDSVADKVLKLAYLNEFTRSLCHLISLLPLAEWISKMYGIFTEKQGDKVIDAFMAKFGFDPAGNTWRAKNEFVRKKMSAFGIDHTEWKKQRGHYKSFQDFFTRELKRGVRPISEPNNLRTIVAPADSKLTVVENINNDLTLFNVKQDDFNLNRFLGDSAFASQFNGGTMMIFRLAPYNYHRYHFATDAIPLKGKLIKGIGLESVNPIVFKARVNPLIINKRILVPLQTLYGLVAMVMVGAYSVNSINNTCKPCVIYAKGDELGYFAFGSTIVLLFSKGAIAVETPFIKHSAEGLETAVKVGEKVATFIGMPKFNWALDAEKKCAS